MFFKNFKNNNLFLIKYDFLQHKINLFLFLLNNPSVKFSNKQNVFRILK